MKSLQFESSPFYILLCLAVGLGYAFLLYKAKAPWTERVNQFLFVLRAILVALLAVLLLGPILKITNQMVEKPTVAFLIDNSNSVQESTDSLTRRRLLKEIEETKNKFKAQGYEITTTNLDNSPTDKVHFTSPISDLTSAIRGVTARYEGKNLAGIVLISDGIYNTGTSPLYSPGRVPISTIGVGDTTNRVDLVLKNVAYNKITYQGNKFPVRAEVIVQELPNQKVTISVLKNGKVLSTQQKDSGTNSFLGFDFSIEALEKGIQRLDVVVEPVRGEASLKNNRSSFFVEVVEGRKKILLIAPAPHPDIKAIKAVVDNNFNYELVVHIPGVTELNPSMLKPNAAELVIFHQVADRNNRTASLYQQFKNSSASLLLIIGMQSNLRQLGANQIPLNFEGNGQWDEVTPVINTTFRDFNFLENSNGVFSKYPPLNVPFGKFSFPTNASILLYQRIGSVATDRPLLLTWVEDKHKVAAIVGEGFWKWRLSEYSNTEKTVVFDDVFSKLIQYLSTLEDKRKFRSFAIQTEFSEATPVVIESQVYNDLFEPIYGNTIAIELKNEKGEITSYQYTTSPGGSRYQIGGLVEGVYQFKSSTDIQGKREQVGGQFLVTAQNIESQNLTADFGLLRKLSLATGGKFYLANEITQLKTDVENEKPQAIIRSNESFNSLINLKWFCFLLLALIATEWFFRKYHGGY
ncbi:MAG: VWA domain-containing protein [Flammeovirgaceae bacterium]|nr:VWA domain-containing protein [Flammeovirgaceae bacterium]